MNPLQKEQYNSFKTPLTFYNKSEQNSPDINSKIHFNDPDELIRKSERIKILQKSIMNSFIQMKKTREELEKSLDSTEQRKEKISPFDRKIREYVAKKGYLGKLNKILDTKNTQNSDEKPSKNSQLEFSWDDGLEEEFQKLKNNMRKRSHCVFFYFYDIYRNLMIVT